MVPDPKTLYLHVKTLQNSVRSTRGVLLVTGLRSFRNIIMDDTLKYGIRPSIVAETVYSETPPTSQFFLDLPMYEDLGRRDLRTHMAIYACCL